MARKKKEEIKEDLKLELADEMVDLDDMGKYIEVPLHEYSRRIG